MPPGLRVISYTGRYHELYLAQENTWVFTSMLTLVSSESSKKTSIPMQYMLWNRNLLIIRYVFCIEGQTGDKKFDTICKENTNTISFLKIRGNVAS